MYPENVSSIDRSNYLNGYLMSGGLYSNYDKRLDQVLKLLLLNYPIKSTHFKT